MKKSLLLVAWLLMFTFVSMAQNRTITGTVTDKLDGQPVPGVTIQVKGTNLGAQTNQEGKYSISIPSGTKILVFQYIGYITHEVTIGAGNNYNVALEQDSKQLGEVVVTALGVSREKKTLGYAVSTVSPDNLLQKSEPDMLKGMQGKVAGVDIRASQGTPGAATRINIRGYTSFYGDNEPLIVVDGIPYSNDVIESSDPTSGGGAYSSGLSSLDPNDIESISVLKGAAAAALYGSRASNGALIIKTKSGSSKLSQKGLEVTFASSAAMEEIANLPNYQNTYGAGTLFTYANANGSWGEKFGSRETIPTWPAYLAAFPDQFGPTVPYQAYPNNVKDLFDKGSLYENSISIQSGTEKTSLSGTASYLTQSGYVPESDFSRVSLSFGGLSKLTNGLTAAGNFAYSNSNQAGGVFGENQVDGAASSFARNLFLARNWNLAGLPYEDADGFPVSTSPAQYDNPLWSWKHNTVKTGTDRYVASLKLSYDIKPINLNVSYQAGANTSNFFRRQIIDLGSRAEGGLGSIFEQNYKKQELESNLVFTYTPHKAFNENFTFRAMGGFNVNQRTTNTQGFDGSQIIAPGIYTITNTKDITKDLLNTFYERQRLWGLYAELTLGYKNYAFLTVTGRNDWSSTLPENNRSYFYPSVSASVIFTDAIGINWGPLDFGKVRASWAKVGRDAPPYSLQNTYSLGNNVVGQPSATQANTALNPNLKPEFTEDIEIGTQLEFLKKLISVDFAWYQRASTNQIAAVPVPTSSGFSNAYVNVGKVTNKGVELELGLNPIRTADWNVNIKGTFTKNKATVNYLEEGLTRLTLNGVLDEISPYIEPGKPFGYLRGTVNYRDSEGNLMINPETGLLIRASGQQMIGDPNPKYKAGISLGVTYKGIFFNTLFDWTQGGDMYSVTVSSLLGRGVTKDTENREGGFVIPGYYGDPNTGEPLLDAGGNKIPNTTVVSMNEMFFGESFAINSATEWNVYDATVYTLRELTLGYDFPKKYFQKTPIGSLSLSFTARNLWFLAPNLPKNTNFNPDVNSFASSTQGIELSAAPTTRRYGVNLKVTF
ncbi:SusC/RagA family TonB-linked outer membrane protein [Solitalea longa]|uniref:SusC/RagA family TonB-linked outer membrane protein n=1 Tax=Solitalea longa TaxID=2079460 RepID=A0A2S5A344_9SPHI|nr:SusC/RagA family TonB-linked outer membrane protein [Solitalea longa]POY36956.1 SusC/RagA family TonB-linked outer membrane protein [Solitalea longa]